MPNQLSCLHAKRWHPQLQDRLVPAHPTANPPDPSLRKLLRQLWGHLGRRRRWQLGAALLLMLASSALSISRQLC